MPRIKIKATFVKVPEATWHQMIGTGSWKVVRGQRDWTQLVVSPDRKEQQALATAWFGNKAPANMPSSVSPIFSELKQSKGVEIIDLPSILVRSKHHGQIDIIRSMVYPTAWKPGAKKEDAWVATTHASENTGLSLYVKPSMLGNGKISLWAAPKISEFKEYKDLGHGRQQAIFSKHQMQTSVTLESDQMVILGGIVNENSQIAEDKVPVLGDLPVLGGLFRTSQKTTSKSYLVILSLHKSFRESEWRRSF